jgi:hypothetical protein
MEDPFSPQNLNKLVIKQQVEEIKALRRKVKQLEHQASIDSWALNPDRSGGAFTDYEIAEANSWR